MTYLAEDQAKEAAGSAKERAQRTAEEGYERAKEGAEYARDKAAQKAREGTEYISKWHLIRTGSDASNLRSQQ